MSRKSLFVLLLFFLVVCTAGCVDMYVYPTKKDSSSHLSIEESATVPKRIGIVLYISTKYEINPIEQFKDGLSKLGLDPIEVKPINNGFKSVAQKKPANLLYLDFDTTFSEEGKQRLVKMLNLNGLLIGWIEAGDEMRNPKVPPVIFLNEVAHVKAKMIDIQPEKVIWSGDGYSTGWTEKRAILNAMDQVLKLLEKDLKKVSK